MKQELLMDAMGYIDADLVEESNFRKRQRVRPRKALTLLLVAVLTFAFAVSAFAESRYEWDIDLMNYTGLSNADTRQLESGLVEINSSDTQYVQNQLTGEEEEIRINAATSIGDSSNVYIKIETNITLPEGYDYVMPDNDSLSLQKKKGELSEAYGCQFESLTEDGNVYFMLEIDDAAHLSRDYVNLTFDDFYAYKTVGDEEERVLLYEGSWNLNWKYFYKSNRVIFHPYRFLTIGGEKILLTKIKITPLEVKAYAVGFQDPDDIISSQFEVESLTLKDGTIIDFGTRGGGGYYSTSPLYYFSTYSQPDTRDTTDTVLNPKDVESVTINGMEISIK